MSNWEYLMVLGACVLVTLPLEFLGARVYRRPRRLVRAIAPVAVVFLGWDLVAIAGKVWGYNPEFITGLMFPPGLPIEEVLFFVVIPVCGILTYECVGAISRRLRGRLGRTRDTR